MKAQQFIIQLTGNVKIFKGNIKCDGSNIAIDNKSDGNINIEYTTINCKDIGINNYGGTLEIKKSNITSISDGIKNQNSGQVIIEECEILATGGYVDGIYNDTGNMKIIDSNITTTYRASCSIFNRRSWKNRDKWRNDKKRLLWNF